MNFEQKLKRIEEITERLEQAELPLEDSVGLYEEGSQLIRDCQQQLDRAETRIRLIQDGTATEMEPPRGAP